MTAKSGAPLLKGIRVLDFGRYIAGPYCAAMLADLGAEVIRIDKPAGSEDRYVSPVTDTGEGALFLHCNRNKLGITLDPAHPLGRELARRLIATADVVVANLPQGALVQLGLDYPSLVAIKPDIILSSQNAFGSTGPYAGRTGFDGVVQAMSGATFLSGRPGHPTKSYASWVDFGTAMYAAYGTLAALFHKFRTGHGQLVESSLLRSALGIFHFNNVEALLTGNEREPTENRSQFGGPADLFRTQDGWIQLQVIGMPLFRRWCRLVGAKDWADDSRFQTDSDRGENGLLLSERTQEWCGHYTTAQALDKLAAAKIPAGPLLAPLEVFDDAQVVDTEMLTPIAYPGLAQPAPLMGLPVQLSAQFTGIVRRPPTLGEHNAEIYGALGYDEEELASLRAAGAI